MKGATWSGEFMYKKGDVLQSQSKINVCAYMYVHAGVCVHVCMYISVRGEFTVLRPFQAERSQLSS